MFDVDNFIEGCEAMKIQSMEYELACEGFFFSDKAPKGIKVDAAGDLVDFIHVDGRKEGLMIPSQKWVKGFWERNKYVSPNLLKNLSHLERVLDILENARREYHDYGDISSMSQSELKSKYDTWSTKYIDPISNVYNNADQFKGIGAELKPNERKKLETFSQRYVDAFHEVTDEVEQLYSKYHQNSTLKKAFGGQKLRNKTNNPFVNMTWRAYQFMWQILSNCVNG